MDACATCLNWNDPDGACGVCVENRSPHAGRVTRWYQTCNRYLRDEPPPPRVLAELLKDEEELSCAFQPS
ncbi:MAG: hypothetical protein P9L99_13390 [Candidatus Lernaella stagnicola]|nr:hypothetical protein [Candidatus Lernaella stagnicola]